MVRLGEGDAGSTGPSHCMGRVDLGPCMVRLPKRGEPVDFSWGEISDATEVFCASPAFVPSFNVYTDMRPETQDLDIILPL